ncbi:hydantoinase B/oxoprolinase family protein [Chloroflexota bacterium]
MGICHDGKTLKETVEEKERLHRETGYAYGLEGLELVESDPAKFMRFQLRLVAACINARETAKLISASPVAMLMGELLFMLANPGGDCVAASYGLAGHIMSFPFIVRSIAELDFEEDPGIKEGDIFGTNDSYYGAPHNADNYSWLPVFYKGELIAWAVGLNHITDVGGLQPGNLSMISPSVFTDGFTYPPTKTGENFKQHKWWDLHWKRRTRTEAFNILDDKMRVAGAISLHNKVLEIVEEFGVDYFRKGLKEIIERERRVLVERIKSQAVPGKYRYLHLNAVRYKGVVGRLFASSNRDWLIHDCGELHVLRDGSLFLDVEGLTSEGDFHCNAYESTVRMAASLGCWPMFAYTATLNTALTYMTHWNLPSGSMFNPQNPFAATVMSLIFPATLCFMFQNCLSYAYFARGFPEECLPGEGRGIGYGLAGVFADGFPWAGGDMCLITCVSSNALPYKDGEPAAFCTPNPATDQGETELAEFVQPTNLTLGKKLVPNYCGHGKFRGGLGIGMCQMIDKPGRSLTLAAMAATGAMGRAGMGMCGGYPGPDDVVYFAHGTNIRELLGEGHTYPKDFAQLSEWIRDGRLKAESVEVYQGPSPNVECRDGDLFACATNGQGGWGDPLERDISLVERDVRYGWITPDVAAGVYGVMIDGGGRAKATESNDLRQKMHNRRKLSSVDARDWWANEREQVLRKGFCEDVYNMYADCLNYEKFRREFVGMWLLPQDFSL